MISKFRSKGTDVLKTSQYLGTVALNVYCHKHQVFFLWQ